MSDAPVVTVVVDGRRLDATHAARLQGDVVVGPISPFVREVALAVDRDATGTRFTIVRGGKRLEVSLGSTRARMDGRVVRLPAAPFTRDGTVYVPIGAIARELGAYVGYDARTRTMTVALVPAPLATMTPFATYVAPPPPLPTFAPKATPEPRAVVSGIPHPRRTPILVEPDAAPSGRDKRSFTGERLRSTVGSREVEPIDRIVLCGPLRLACEDGTIDDHAISVANASGS